MKTRKFKYQPMGTISHGTMRAEDLIPAFEAELSFAIQGHTRRYADHAKLCAEACAIEDYGSDQADDVLQALFDALGEHALPYFYFGAHPGDGADYGFWLSESFEEDFGTYGDGLKVNDLADVPKCHTGEVAVVNDHGNVTLYRASRGRLYEIWSIV